MRTSVEWWNTVKDDEQAFCEWLAKQYHGEITAHERIKKFAADHVPHTSKWYRTLETIAAQELQHAEWVGELLMARGITPQILAKDERYWNKTLSHISSFESGAAVAAHAEAMRLERITAITEDESAPVDVRNVFRRILPDEQFHARAFAAMAGETAMAVALSTHLKGMDEIGLIPSYAV